LQYSQEEVMPETHYEEPKPSRPRFAITLSDEDFRKLANRDEFLDEVLVLNSGVEVEVIIQREGR
jgi:hypothetical protein